MSGTTPSRVEVQVGDVTGSQLVIGDHNVIQTPDGAQITIVPTGQRPVARLRPVPFHRLPPQRFPLLGRRSELALAAQVTPATPLQLHGPEGMGKTALLKAAAHTPVTTTEGILYASARRRNLDEVLLSLYEQSWECEVPFVPSPAQVGGYLTDRDALVILDDCGLDRDDLETLLDTAPRCRFLLASPRPTLSPLGRSVALGGLDQTAGIALLERELGRPLQASEQRAATTLIARVNGHPQLLIEAAALVNDGVIELVDQANSPAQESQGRNTDTLSGEERRLLALLGQLDGAALAVPIAARAAGQPVDAELAHLEKRGWVKSASPRFRLVRRLPDQWFADDQKLLPDLLTGLIEFASDPGRGPAEVRIEAEAIEAALGRAAAEQRWAQAVELARVSEGPLARSGAWVSWRRVLQWGLEATRATGDRAGQAYMLHQLGSLAACVGEPGPAFTALHEALRLREQDGNVAGAALTRHNLGQVTGGGGDDGGDEPGSPWRPRPGLLLAGLLLVLVLVGAVAALGSSGSNDATPVNATGTTHGGAVTRTSASVTATQSPSASSSSSATPTSTGRPPPAPAARITIAAPKDGGSYPQGSTPPADYTCAQATSCAGPVASGQPFATSSPGPHTFAVTAKNRDGKVSTRTATYTVTPADTTAPTIVVNSPKDGGVYALGSTSTADYTCTDTGSGVATCQGPVPSGQPFDTSSVGTHTFTVATTDNARNQGSQTVTYTIQAPIQ